MVNVVGSSGIYLNDGSASMISPPIEIIYHIIGCLYFHFIIILSASLNFASGMETWLSAK